MIEPDSVSMEKATVLVVDDSADNIEILAKILHPEYRVIFSTNGRQACLMAKKQSPDLILLDVQMPEMDGYAVCKELKSNPLFMDIPIIFVTAYGEEHFEMTGFYVGGVDYITKSVKPLLGMVLIISLLIWRLIERTMRQNIKDSGKTITVRT